MVKQTLLKGGCSDGCRDPNSGEERLDSTVTLTRTKGGGGRAVDGKLLREQQR